MIRAIYFKGVSDLDEFLKGIKKSQIISILSYGERIVLVYEEKVGK